MANLSREKLFAIILLVLLFVVPLSAQDETPTKVTDQNRSGELPFAGFVGTDVEKVMIAGGNLVVNIPIASVSGRGMPFNFGLWYDARFLSAVVRNTPTQHQKWNIETRPYITSAGLWAVAQPGLSATLFHSDYCYQDFAHPQMTGSIDGGRNYIYHDASGGKHPIAAEWETGYCFPPLTGTPWSYESPGPDLTGEGAWTDMNSVRLADGTRLNSGGISGSGYHEPGDENIWMGYGTFTDPNGNIKSEFAGGLDTLGRSVVTQQNGANYIQYIVKDSTGANRTYTVNYANMTLTTSFGVADIYGTILEYSATRHKVTSIVRPNGQSYSFQYDSYGSITQLTLPTGGVINYGWSNYSNGMCTYRYVSSRTAVVNGQSSLWTFSHVPNSGSATCNPATQVASAVKVTVTDPGNNQSVYVVDRGNVQSAKFYNGAATGSSISEYTIEYQNMNSRANAELFLPIRITTKFSEGDLQSKKEFDYDTFTYNVTTCNQSYTVCDMSGPVTFQETSSRGNVKEIREYDWGTGAPGPLLRRTKKDYLHESNSAYLPYNIVSKIITSTIYDALTNTCKSVSGHCAQTQYEYDQYVAGDNPLLTANPAPQRASGFSATFTVRGNVTRVKRWKNTDGSLVTTTYQFDDLGNIRAIKDPLGHNTTYTYNNNFPDWNCITPFSNPQAWVTEKTNHLGHKIQLMYYPCTGSVTWKRDQNDINAGRWGTQFTYDLMNRPLTQNFPDGGQKVFTYDDNVTFYSPNVREDTLLNPSGTGDPGTCQGDKWATSWTKFDGLGREERTEKCNGLAAPQHVDMVDTCYDLLGRKAFVTYPFQGSGWTVGSYLCSNSQRAGDTFTYDALSRPLTVTNSDGGVVSTTYFSGHQVTVTDQAGKKRKSQTDAIGRLVKVWEPDAGGSFIYETAYQYDVLGNLLRVDQKGNDGNSANWRTRTFEYDSLSRLKKAINPESGTIEYVYDNDGNLTSKTAPAPNQTGSATITTNYQYDALHRLTARTASDNSIGANFYFDMSSIWNMAVSNPIGRLVATYATLSSIPGGVGSVPSYDAMGRVTSEIHFNQHVTPWAPLQTFTYAYNADGSLKSLIYPSGRKLDYTYSLAQRPVSMVDSANGINYVTDATYTAWGAVKGMKNSVTPSFAGITTTNDFNSRMQPVFLSAAAPGGTVMSFGYDFHLGAGNNGNVFQITNNLNNDRTQIFTYDHLNRVATAKTQALIGTHCWGMSFGYDIWANFIDRQPLSGYSGCTGESDPPNANEKNQMIGHCYDAAGNLVELAECSVPYTHGYDAENRLISAPGSMEFDYDGNGRRARKSSGSNGTLYWYGAGGEVLLETNLSGGMLREFVYLNGKRVARRADGTYQSSLTIQNGLLSQANPFDQPPCYCHNLGPIPGWSSTGAATGSWQPNTTASYPTPFPGVIAYSNGGTISQTLATGLQANTTYTLLVDIGRRLEAGLTADYSLTLKAGTTVLATDRRSNGTIQAGTFQTQALVYTAGSAPPAGNLTIVLESHGPQINFKNVRLNLSSVGAVHYFFSNHLGSSNVVTDAAGVIKEDSDYYPFGGERGVIDTLSDQNYKFTGKERDSETGMDYFGARYYGSNLGRFMTIDPVSAITFQQERTEKSMRRFRWMIERPQTWNAYSYALNNPLRFVDPDGQTVRNMDDVNKEIEKRNLYSQAATLSNYVEDLAKDVVAGNMTGEQAVDKIHAKAVELTGGGKTKEQMENALLVAAKATRMEFSGSNRIGERTNLGTDTLHHFFANAFNQVESPWMGVAVTLGAKLRENDASDEKANNAGFRFGSALATRIDGIPSYAEAKGVIVPKPPIFPSDYID